MYSETIVVGAGTEYPLKGLLTLPDGAPGQTAAGGSKPAAGEILGQASAGGYKPTMGEFRSQTPGSRPRRVKGGRPPRVPAVVMVHGSGASNMDEKVMELTPFKDLAEGLARHGIASLRYDKRTFVHGRKMVRDKNLTVREETIDDAILAVQMLRRDPRIDPERIFILGHSMGAMLAPRIDAEGADVRGLIMMAGTPYRLEDIVLRQLRQAAREKSLLSPFVGLERSYYLDKFQGLYEMSDEEAKRKKFAGNVTLYYFKEMGQKTAADYLQASTKPVLILQGGKDFQVLADRDYRRFRVLFAGRPNTTFKLYPELNHCFVKGIYSEILKASKEYSVERHIPEEVIGDIAAFVEGC